MKRQVPGLSDTARDSHSEVPDGVFLVRLDGAQHRWQAQKRFYLLRLSVLEPKPFAGRSMRDRNTCQYCGEACPPGELTLDHVVPRSRGGNSTWENLVACCHECNRKKGNRLMSEIDDMILLREPKPFSLHTSRQIMRMLGRSDDRWRKYLFY